MARACLFTFKFSISLCSRNCYLTNVKHGQTVVFLHHNARCYDKVNGDKYTSESDSESDFEIESEKQKENVRDVKVKVLDAALKFVPEYGWTKKAIAKGAQSLELSPAVHGLLQDGGAELVHYFNFTSNNKLQSYLQENYPSDKKYNIQEYIEDALKNRLQMIIPFSTRWSEAMALMVLPSQLSTDTKNLYDLIDIIWHLSQDKSIDFTWYTKRASLAFAYKACELCLIQDRSPEYSNTFMFLERQVDAITSSNNCIKKVANICQYLPELQAGAVITLRNLLGANRWFR